MSYRSTRRAQTYRAQHEAVCITILAVILAATVGLFVASFVTKAGANLAATVEQAREMPQGW